MKKWIIGLLMIAFCIGLGGCNNQNNNLYAKMWQVEEKDYFIVDFSYESRLKTIILGEKEYRSFWIIRLSEKDSQKIENAIDHKKNITVTITD